MSECAIDVGFDAGELRLARLSIVGVNAASERGELAFVVAEADAELESIAGQQGRRCGVIGEMCSLTHAEPNPSCSAQVT